jgi:hypothetical protein
MIEERGDDEIHVIASLFVSAGLSVDTKKWINIHCFADFSPMYTRDRRAK